MTILEMIAEWRKGYSNTMHDDEGNFVDPSLHPEQCPECTLALISSIEEACKRNENMLQ